MMIHARGSFKVLRTESQCTSNSEITAELGGVLLSASHEVLERGILASLDMTISVDVHFLEDVKNVSHAAIVVLNVSKNSVDTVVLA